jgi:hypothetical protein
MKVFVLLSQCMLLAFSLLSNQEDSISFIPPTPYSGISSVFIQSTQSFYFHSGLLNDISYLTGIQTIFYDNQTLTWRYSPGDNINYPDSRAFYGSFLYQDNFYYIFGGIGLAGVYKDMWKYDIANDIWTEVQVNNFIPRRYNFAYTSFTHNSVFYFAVLGGESNSESDNLIDFYL